VAEVAELIGFSTWTVARMFEKEKGVLILERPETVHKRRYRSMRIPVSVLERVIKGLAVKGQ
jgi:hypothetical protein